MGTLSIFHYYKHAYSINKIVIKLANRDTQISWFSWYKRRNIFASLVWDIFICRVSSPFGIISFYNLAVLKYLIYIRAIRACHGRIICTGVRNVYLEMELWSSVKLSKDRLLEQKWSRVNLLMCSSTTNGDDLGERCRVRMYR